MGYKSSRFKKLGFRSGFEVTINQQLVDMDVPFAYEGDLNTIRYIIPAKEHRYLCDFLLANGVMIEAKGLFTAQDRKKHILIKQQYPHLDVRFVFMNAGNKLSKTSRTTYGDWAEKNGFKWAHREVPVSWVKEKKTKAELDGIIKTLKEFQKGKR